MRMDDSQVTTAEVKEWKGLHLLHFPLSSCSQKVRILLREKQLEWESHPIDLMREAHVTPWFLGINPRGVVPVLVHDGVVHVESNDILQHLDALPSPADSYFPLDAAEREVARQSLAAEDALHMDLRAITMGFLAPSRLVRKSPKTLEAYEKDGARDDKRDHEIAWWRDFAKRGITRERALRSANAFEQAFDVLESRLADGPWLIGDRISVLEIAWFISIHRVVFAGYPIEHHPRLEAHYRKLLERPAFAKETRGRGPAAQAQKAYRMMRRLTRSTLRHVLESA